MRRDLLDELLHAAFMVQQCYDSTADKSFGKAIGELDWVTEIQRLKEEILCSR